MTDRMFPVLSTNRPEGCPTHIRWDALDPAYAFEIHSQSLERLAERGGLSTKEIVMNVEHRDFFDIGKIGDEYAINIVKKLAG